MICDIRYVEGLLTHGEPRTRLVTMGCFGNACNTRDQRYALGMLSVALPLGAATSSSSTRALCTPPPDENVSNEADDACMDAPLFHAPAAAAVELPALSFAAQALLTNRFIAMFQNEPSTLDVRSASGSYLEVVICAARESGRFHLRQHDHGTTAFEDRLVISPDGYARWECSSEACRGVRDRRRESFIRAPRDLAIVFPASMVVPLGVDSAGGGGGGRGGGGGDDPLLDTAMRALNDRYAVARYCSGEVRLVDLMFRNPDTGDTRIRWP